MMPTASGGAWPSFSRGAVSAACLAVLLPCLVAAQGPDGRGAYAVRPAHAEAPATVQPVKAESSSWLGGFGGGLLAPQSAEQVVKLMLLTGVLSLAPAVLMMLTCFVRLSVVLGMLRQALGGPPGLPQQVLTVLAVFMTGLIMWPVWEDVRTTALEPLSKQDITWDEAWRRAERPLRRFMSLQIERTGNQADVWIFLRHWPEKIEPKTYDDVPTGVLVPAFLLSELKTAFLIGFQICLPFLVIDLVTAAALTSLGMLMLPPNAVALPLKILLFTAADGWNLIVGMLLTGFQAYGSG